MSLGQLEMSVPAVDGLILKGTLRYPAQYAGITFPLVVLAHQYPATRDSYAPLVADLFDSGIATLAFDQRGHGASVQGPKGPLVIDTPEGLTAEAFGVAFVSSVAKVGFARIDNDILRVTGWGGAQNFIDSSRIALVGASIGGSGALLAASKIPELRAVATLGAAGAPAFGRDAPARIRSAVEQLKIPVYLASSRADSFEGGANVAAWGGGLPHVTSRIVPGSAHAMAIYYDVRDDLLRFLQQSLQLQ